MIGAVYNKSQNYFTLSPLLTIKRSVKWNSKFDFNIVEQHGGKFSLFHTVDEDVKRMNPSYYLNFDIYEEYRYWPKNEKFASPSLSRTSIYFETEKHAEFNIQKNVKKTY